MVSLSIFRFRTIRSGPVLSPMRVIPSCTVPACRSRPIRSRGGGTHRQPFHEAFAAPLTSFCPASIISSVGGGIYPTLSIWSRNASTTHHLSTHHPVREGEWSIVRGCLMLDGERNIGPLWHSAVETRLRETYRLWSNSSTRGDDFLMSMTTRMNLHCMVVVSIEKMKMRSTECTPD